MLVFLDQLGSSASPALLFSLGVILSSQKLDEFNKLVVLLTFIKLIAHPLLAWCFISLIFGHYPIEHKSALMVAAAPCGVMSYCCGSLGIPKNRGSFIIGKSTTFD